MSRAKMRRFCYGLFRYVSRQVPILDPHRGWGCAWGWYWWNSRAGSCRALPRPFVNEVIDAGARRVEIGKGLAEDVVVRTAADDGLTLV